MNLVTIDLRMWHASGIGTYLKNLIPRAVENLTGVRFLFIGDQTQLVQYPWISQADISILHCRLPIYSVMEQLELWRRIPRETTLCWIPHYNIPVGYRGRLLVTVHDVFHLAMPHLVGGWHRRFYARAMFHAVRQKAAAILCVSEFTMHELEKYTGVGRNRMFSIHNGIDETWFEVADRPKPHDRPYLLFLGNVKPHKNLSGLLEAFGSILDRVAHDLIVVGRNDGLITLDRDALSRSKELKGRVRFTGCVDDSLIKQYTAHADCLVFPSFYEGFGFPPLEAMACGTPVVVSKIPALVETCGDAALFCEPSNPRDIAAKILQVIEDGRLRIALRRKGIERAREFGWDRCAAKTCHVIQELLER